MSPTTPTLVRIALVAAGAAALAWQAGDDGGRLLDGALHHLGDETVPAWSEAPAAEGTRLALPFEARANDREWTLEVAQRGVDDRWTLALNGRAIAELRKTSDRLETCLYPVAAGAIVNGVNELTVSGANPRDDILVGRFRLYTRSLRQVAKLGRLDVSVTDVITHQRIPARVTVVDERGELAMLYYAEARTTAVRQGIAYTCNGTAALELPAGRYVITATRGMEWSMGSQEVTVGSGQQKALDLTILREVDTTGWIAADTHIHTLTFSGHGDASLEERVVTIAGEGIELPVATDHNHQTDYAPVQRELKLAPWFTPVVGNEVTTDNGHMNAFPLEPNGPVPASDVTDWEKLVEGIRARGAQVVILNHPRWPEKGRDPLTRFGFDERNGANAAGQKFTFDCLELVNSDAPTQPTEAVLRVWYALLNRGERFPGVGASDSHHVGVIVGQGRTYVPSETDDPAKIDVAAAMRAMKEGRTSISHGLFATIEVDGQSRMGDVAPSRAGSIEAAVDVRHPSWIAPTRLDLVVDGSVAASVDLSQGEPGDTATRCLRRVRVPVPAHDGWLVAVAWGDGVKLPCWTTELKETVAITNPVWLDFDGDGRCDSPRALAKGLLEKSGAAIPALAAAIAEVDDAVGFQLLDLLRESLGAAGAGDLAKVAAGAGPRRHALADWVTATFPSPSH
jgi:hypothetical protein